MKEKKDEKSTARGCSLHIGYEAKRVFHNKTGLGNYSRDLVRILSTFYPENTFFLYNPKPQKNALFEANQSSVFEKRPQSFWYKKFYNIWRQFGVVADLKKDKIQIFHGLSGELPFGLKKAKIKSVVTIHDLIFLRYPAFYSYFDRKIHYYKFKKAAKQADVVVAISQQTKQDIVDFLKIDASKIKVIYQGCQTVFKEQYSASEKAIVAQKYQLPDQFLLNVGTIEERKNVLSVLQAIKDLNSTLVILGKETQYAQTVRAYIADHHMQNRVVFLKSVSPKELAILYQLATVFVYPSVFEGFGIPILEALFSKTPVITTNSGVFPEAGGPDSVYVDPNDVDLMREKIQNLFSDVELRNQISEKGFIFAQKFNDNVIAENLMQLYNSL